MFFRYATPPPAGAPAEPKKRRSSLSAGISKAATLTKTAIIGKAAPSRLKKTGVLVLDGHRRYCKLGGGTFTIYAADSKAGAAEDKAIFRAPIKFIKVVGYGPGGRRETAELNEKLAAALARA